jgi:hypothetical protein
MVARLLEENVGAAFFGLVAASILYGMTNLQTYIYFTRFPKDWIFHKTSVGALWALDSFHLALTIHLVHFYLVESFGNVFALASIVWSLKIQIAVNIVIILIVQSLYCIRIWKISSSRSKILPIGASIVVLGGFAIGIALAVLACNAKTFNELSRWSWAIYSSFALSTSIDIVLAGSMVFFLKKSDTGFSGTHSVMAILIRYILSSGLITSACSMAALIAYITMPHNLVFLGIEFLLTKLYVNSFLAMLNARKGMRSRSTEESVSISLNNITKPRGMTLQQMASPKSPTFGTEPQTLRIDTAGAIDRAADNGSPFYSSPFAREFKAPPEWETTGGTRAV